MKVSQALLDATLNEPEKAIAMINVFSRSTLAAPPSALGPGTWVYGVSTALNRRVLASNWLVDDEAAASPIVEKDNVLGWFAGLSRRFR